MSYIENSNGIRTGKNLEEEMENRALSKFSDDYGCRYLAN
jgi:hypothetical protein